MTDQLRRASRALISVSDKTGVVEFARALAGFGIELVSTGGTRKTLSDAGLKVLDVSDLTGFPEMMDGRVKTLHPAVHGGLLAIRGNPAHAEAMRAHGIRPIDILVVNLYPFEETVARGGDFADCIENIDIGGPAMIRAAAKNHDDVAVLVEASDYAALLDELAAHSGMTTLALRRRLAAKAYARTAAYDAAIANWFAAKLDEIAPDYRAFGGRLIEKLRYGENPHQSAAFYRTPDVRFGVATRAAGAGQAALLQQHQRYRRGLRMRRRVRSGAHRGLRHHQARQSLRRRRRRQPCSMPIARRSPAIRFRLSAASSRSTARSTPKRRAPSPRFSPRSSSRRMRPRRPSPSSAPRRICGCCSPAACPIRARSGLAAKTVAGGLLVQTRDNAVVDDMDLRPVTKRAPTNAELRDLRFAFRVAKHVKSNTIVYAKDLATVGIGAGQMSRVDAARIAARKAQDAAKEAGLKEPATKGSVVASDAFFPFADGLLVAIEAGATAVIQPGGSVRDDEVIKAADDHGIAMVFTGTRHFRH